MSNCSNLIFDIYKKEVIIIVSIIIPVYNAEKYLEKCIESVINQSYENVEIILVDDGSNDQSLIICKTYAAHDRRIKVFTKENNGVSSARNYGICKAQGEYIVFIDSDDWIDEVYISSLLESIQNKNSDIALCGYRIVVFSDNKITKEQVYCPSFSAIKSKKEFEYYFPEQIDKRFILAPWAKIYKSSIIKKYNLKFDESKFMGEDLLFNLAYLSYSINISTSLLAGYNYRIAGNESLTKKFGPERIESTEDIFIKGFEFCNNLDIDEIKWVFSKYYFKSHLNFLETKMNLMFDKKLINDYINEILEQKSVDEALLHKYFRDRELLLYNVIFSSKSPLLIKIMCKLRIFIKKRLRGF